MWKRGKEDKKKEEDKREGEKEVEIIHNIKQDERGTEEEVGEVEGLDWKRNWGLSYSIKKIISTWNEALDKKAFIFIYELSQFHVIINNK